MRIKIILAFLLFTLNLAFVHSQSMEFLDANKVKAAFWADGAMFWDKVSEPRFEWPKDSGTHVNFVTGLWFGGRTATDSIYGAYMKYGTHGNDYFPGPLDTVGTASIDSNTMALYNRVWKVTAAEIDQYKYCTCTNPSDSLCNGYTIPASILQWPGNPIVEADGDHLLMAQQLAPYFDANGNGVYEPNNCEYPLIKCDQALFYVFNDRGGLHMESQLPSVGLEIRAMAYACSCDSLNTIYPSMDDAIFLDLEMIHRGTVSLYQSYVGLYTDADIGGANDDFMGTHVDGGYTYYYNGDNFDAAYNGAEGYGSLPPAHAIVFLEGPYMDANGQDDDLQFSDIPAFNDSTLISGAFGVNGLGFNDAIVDNEKLGLCRSKYLTVTVDPVTPFTNYWLQTARWDNGTAQIYGGTGYPAGPFLGSPRARFVWPDNFDSMNWGTSGINPSFAWSEFENGMGAQDIPDDRRSVSSSGPFTLLPGEVNKLTYAFVTARSSNPADSLSLNSLHQAVQDVKDGYFQGLGSCAFHIGIDEVEVYQASMYPNPAGQTVWISTTEPGDAAIVIYDISGRVVHQTGKPAGETLVSINLEAFAPGLYTVLIHNSKTQRGFKLIKK